ncbi:MAG: hypothetical protein V4726_11990 [Verrucomicrobiota bacterium]
MKTTFLLILPAMAVLSLTSCDSAEEKARKKALESQADQLENKADATRKMGETSADAKEKDAKTGAAATRDNTETKADTLEDQADAVRKSK